MKKLPLSFSLPVKLSGKARPRFLRQSGRTYTPKKTIEQEHIIREAFACKNGRPSLTCPLSVKIELILEPAKSWPKYKRLDALGGRIMPTSKPDLDNVAKLILDALNGIAYKDDSQVTTLEISRSYGISNKVSVEIYPIGGSDA